MYKASENTVSARVAEIMNMIITEKDLPFYRADVFLQDAKRKEPDIIIRRMDKTAYCAWESKRPQVPVYQVELFKQARGYAERAGLPFFVTFNLKKIVLWHTFEEGVPLTDRRFKEYVIGEIESLEQFDNPKFLDQLKTTLTEFLMDLTYSIEKKTEDILPSLPLDTIFINYLHSLIEAIKIPLISSIEIRLEDENFVKKLKNWFIEQGWSFTIIDREIIDKVSMQYTLLLINKIMFYDIIRANYSKLRPDTYKILGLPKELPKLDISSVDNGFLADSLLDGYFESILKIDFETIYRSNFFDEIKLPDEVVPQIRELINEFNKYNFAKIDFEILGNIFESLIPEEDRHKLGQYFTRSDVVDIIISACVKNSDDYILDPASGAGTFLVRSFSRLKYLNKDFDGDYGEFITKLWGSDIAKFPSHLTTINLAIKTLPHIENYPKIVNKDFFDINPKSTISEVLNLDGIKLKGINEKEIKEKIPTFNAVITNPPYTRQEEMEEKTRSGYKDNIIKLIKDETQIKVGKRASIYTYFFFHGAQFIDNGGMIGLITSNSWLDTDYGKYLEEFLLKNFEIVAIIESRVERWFDDADVNTVITILRKCKSKEKRNKNLVKFIQLEEDLPKILERFSSLSKFEDLNDDQRWESMDKFWDFIGNIKEYHYDSKKKILVFTINQNQLWNEGFDKEKNRFVGAKWGKYIRAPKIFYKVLENGKDFYVPLNQLAHIRRGFTSGANNFFYLSNEDINNWMIEKEFWMHPLKKNDSILIRKDVWEDENGDYFNKSQYNSEFTLEEVMNKEGHVLWAPNYVIKSPKETTTVEISPKILKNKILLINKDKEELKESNILKYIEWGEEQNFHVGSTCSSRRLWYRLGNRSFADYLWTEFMYERSISFHSPSNIFESDKFYGIIPNDRSNDLLLRCYLNSSLIPLFRLVSGFQSLGEGALKMAVYEVANLPVIDSGKISVDKKIEPFLYNLEHREIGTLYDEIGASSFEEVTLEKVKKDRREIDRFIMEDVLNLSESDQLKIYQSIIKMLKTRIEKAQSVKKKKKTVSGINVIELKKLVLDKLDLELYDKISNLEIKENYKEIEIISEGKISVNVDYSGIPYVKIGDYRIDCKFLKEAQYVKYCLLMGKNNIRIPMNDENLEELLDDFKRMDENIKESITKILELTASDEKTKKQLRSFIYNDIWKR